VHLRCPFIYWKARLRLLMAFTATAVAIGIMAACSRSATLVTEAASTWNPKAAAAYLDQRAATWALWAPAARDHGTYCVSCHTALPYALSRPVLRKALGERQLSANERALLEDVNKRVRMWDRIGPYYTGDGYDDAKPNESRGTESVLNAFILAIHDAEEGNLSVTTQTAFRNMWGLQQKQGTDKGAWPWLQFGMEPFEAKDSAYYGACLAAVAVGTAPDAYRSAPEMQENIVMLSDYLNREYATQSTMNRVTLLWASAKFPGLISKERRQSIVDEVSDAQQADGGWNLSSLAWPRDSMLRSVLRSLVRSRWRSDGTRQHEGSDAYATAFIAFTLQQAGISNQDPRLQRALSWLRNYQNRDQGSWSSFSLTKHRDPSSNVGRFMDDAATGYAALALSETNNGR
jgi:squalene-hopene/tetraprenyl-beta-curcumene cyclase